VGNLSLVFRIMGIDGLCKTTKANVGVGFAMVDHIILDMFHKTVVHFPMEFCISPLDVCGLLLELDEAFCDLVIFLHAGVAQVQLHLWLQDRKFQSLFQVP